MNAKLFFVALSALIHFTSALAANICPVTPNYIGIDQNAIWEDPGVKAALAEARFQ